MEIMQIYNCQEILMRAGELQTDEKKECDKLFKDPKTRELLIKEEERLKNMKDNLEQEIVKNSHWIVPIDHMQEVLEDMKDSTTLNTKNINALKSMDADKLKDVSIETIYAFTKTVAQNPVDMSGNLDKVLDSYKQIEKATELEVDNFEKSIDCILYNECN
ncbi:hypothetical protein N3Z17_02395 [Candidatus Bandiella numerosa]|uniref:hypothetical protein n=1 Tax=Candidatus Bandiella numerosa TaxID=2570586 RepID=UPI00249E0D77|nr:hypothetical protein [Candidatus Bandiella numerosa]WHA05379.1 hypothetical protein N3Z17_02395 [Candidatus Bandiella numerosa]